MNKYETKEDATVTVTYNVVTSLINESMGKWINDGESVNNESHNTKCHNIMMMKLLTANRLPIML